MPEGAPARLDALLAARGLVKSRTAAVKLIQAGRVSVDGVTAIKASAPVAGDALLAVDPEDDWVSRAAHKLVGALDAFGVDPAGRIALDVGASTGGFTQVLLDRGAERVIALDVGHGQLDPRVAMDPRVVSVEGTNARSITADDVRAMDPAAARIDMVVGDLSFISLRLVLPALVDAVVDPFRARDLVLLVKPQFEVGRTGVREGIVHDADLRNDAVMNVLWTAWDRGLGTVGVVPSPIVGTHGNREFLVHLQPVDGHAHGEHEGASTGRPGPNPTEWIDRVTRMTEGT
ncbi:TlyA family RNA methyltransferase [Curtobacterium sp. RRHDQ10]|uniref:TlyA family RNA methyltransferase n=1 Tax=Curtobacterium phyllosphaerae TaxID=3413379 RepID=UPI003BF28CA7